MFSFRLVSDNINILARIVSRETLFQHTLNLVSHLFCLLQLCLRQLSVLKHIVYCSLRVSVEGVPELVELIREVLNVAEHWNISK